MNKKEENNKDERVDEKGKQHVPFYKLFSYAEKMDTILMVLGTAGALANGATMPVVSIVMGNMVHAFGNDQNTSQVVHNVSKICVQFIYLGIGSFVSSTLRERQATRIRKLYFNSLLNQEIAFFDSQVNTGEVLEKMSADIILIQNSIGEKVGTYIQIVSCFFFGFIVAFAKGWLLTLIIMSATIPLLVVRVLKSKNILIRVSSGHKANTEASIIIQQTTSLIKTVVSFTGENASLNRFEQAMKNSYQSIIREGFVIGLWDGLEMFSHTLVHAIGFWYGARLIHSNTYTGREVVTVILAIMFALSSLQAASQFMVIFIEGQVAAFEIYKTINRKPEIDASNIEGKVLDAIQGDIEFKDVYFSYPSKPKDKILAGLSVFIEGGKTTALVGESGSGKSTIISLIERFYDPQSGEVLIDGINIKQFYLKWLRENIGLVSQEPVLFESTIKENVLYGKNNANIKEIESAIHLANASNFISMLPQGLDTMVGQNGAQLSGGQKQRIAIARALLKNPRIMLLDEATSALDVESEQIVQEALNSVMINRTTIIIAHRLITVKHADSIVVMHQGSILEKGTHFELLNNQNGAYNQLIALQLLNLNNEQSTEYNKDKANSILSMATNNTQQQPLISSHSFESSLEHSIHSLSSIKDIDYAEGELQRSIAGESKNSDLRRLAYLNKPEVPFILIGSLAAIFNGLLNTIKALMMSNYVDIFYKSYDTLQRKSLFWSLILLLYGIINLFAIPIRSGMFAIAGARLIRRVRLMAFQKIINMEISWFDNNENSSEAISSRLSSDAATLKIIIGDSLSYLVRNMTAIFGGLVIAFIASWQLSLCLIALLTLLPLGGCIRETNMKILHKGDKMIYEEGNQVANEALRSIRTIASFSAEEKVMGLYNKSYESHQRDGIKRGWISGMLLAISDTTIQFINAAFFYVGSQLVSNGTITYKQVFQVFYAYIFTSLDIFIRNASSIEFQKAKYVAASIFRTLDLQPKIDPSCDPGLSPETINGEIEFHNVCFNYPIRPDVKVFRDMCLYIQSRKVIALVGESGCGKSTAIALLQRFYYPNSGHILLDGIDIQKIQLRWLRQQMGLVSQEPVLFNDTIYENIAFGKEGNVKDDEIINAAKLANADIFISSLSQGYQTMVGEYGIQLSGGQKQRVAIARAVLKQPKIMLMDEATSALDVESEKIVQHALNQSMLNRTTLIVAHRFATIRNADLIAVIKDGGIAEQGKHDALMNIENGIYASMVVLNSNIAS